MRRQQRVSASSPIAAFYPQAGIVGDLAGLKGPAGVFRSLRWGLICMGDNLETRDWTDPKDVPKRPRNAPAGKSMAEAIEIEVTSRFSITPRLLASVPQTTQLLRLGIE